MNIQTVAENLRNTIKGKEQLLASYTEQEQLGVYPKTLEYKGICDMLEINIAELSRILSDIEICSKQESDCNWIIHPDQMGGAFTAEELDANRGWK